MTRGSYKPQLVWKVAFHSLYLDIVETPPDVQFRELNVSNSSLNTSNVTILVPLVSCLLLLLKGTGLLAH